METFIELTILMPCHNEAGSVGACIAKAKKFLEINKIAGEIIVVDNGSSDGSGDIAKKTGAKVLMVSELGYGNAVREGIRFARGKYIIVGDADDTYDFSELAPYLDKLRGGYDLVMGNRFRGGIKKGAMPFLHRYFGNPTITVFGNLLFGHISGDLYSGLRGLRKENALKLVLKETGVEYAAEMAITAKLNNLKMIDVPIILYPAPPSHVSHISTWRHGWKTIILLLSLRFRRHRTII